MAGDRARAGCADAAAASLSHRTLLVLGHAALPFAGCRSRPRMPAGTTCKLQGLQIEVLADLPDAGPTRARFSFDKPLEDPSLAFYRWDERTFIPFTPPRIGEQLTLPGAVLPGGIKSARSGH
jgi:hypothetical protein